MEINKIIKDIFELDISLKDTDTHSEKGILKHLRVPHTLNSINIFIEEKLSNAATQDGVDSTIGRIGPRIVKFDISRCEGIFIISPDRLSIHSQSHFGTIRANTAVYKGKWMYELQLGSKGRFQVGWSTFFCNFNQTTGVGDTTNSYAYDGSNSRKWNEIPYKYGEPWLTGDIIGCAIDMDLGNVDFYRNGRTLGRAFENITIGTGFVYAPTVSLGVAENLTANFGSTPMHYPVDGYEPLQAAPEKEIIQATLLFQWFVKIVELLNVTTDRQTILPNESMSIQAFLMCLSRSVLKHIGPLITIPYITEHIFVPFIQRLAEAETNSVELSVETTTCSSMLSKSLDLLWTLLEEHEIKACLETTVLYLLSTFRQVTLFLEYPEQHKSLFLLTKICQHSVTRQYLLQYLLFDRGRFANFMHITPLDEGGLANIVNNVWWETNPVDLSIENNKANYLDASRKLNTAVSEVEQLQVKLLVILLNNLDGNEKKASSRIIFLRKFKRFVQDNLTSNRTLPIALCCFHRLLEAFRILWNMEIGTYPVYVPCRTFYDESIDYHIIERLGGVLSHLKKTFKAELIDMLGPDHEVILAMNQTEASPNRPNTAIREVYLPIAIHMLTLESGTIIGRQEDSIIFARHRYPSHEVVDNRGTRQHPVTSATVLLELLESIILFYHVIAKKQLAEVAVLRNSMVEYINAVQNMKVSLKQIRENDSNSQLIQRELLRAISVFNMKLIEQARYMAWICAAVFSEEKQSQLAWLLRVVILTLNNASSEGNLFSFVPYFYLETLADLCVSLKNHVHPTAHIEQIPDSQEMLTDIGEFLCKHFKDSRIVNATSKGTLLLTLARFASNKLTLNALENVTEEYRIKVVTNLLKSYDDRAWAESNWILVRFWQGNGFAFRYAKSPHLLKKIGLRLLQEDTIFQSKIHASPCPSTIYQNHVKDVLLQNKQAAAKCLNSLLNQLNWAFSNFIDMMLGIHNISTRSARVFIESKQLKMCATCFDLTVSLLRVLEMIVTVALSIFNDPSYSSTDNLLSRLCQFLCQVLNRMSSRTGCFQHVVSLEISGLEAVEHFPILTAVTGILLALLCEDMYNSKSKPFTELQKITQTLLMEPSFEISSLYFLLDDKKHKVKKDKISESFSFTNYPDDISDEEIKRVKDMVEYLEQCCTILPDSKVLNEDENTCTICYAYPIAATFEPCHHQTCRNCIERHLLNTRECFFCKVTIDKVVDVFGNTLHDFTNESSTLN